MLKRNQTKVDNLKTKNSATVDLIEQCKAPTIKEQVVPKLVTTAEVNVMESKVGTDIFDLLTDESTHEDYTASVNDIHEIFKKVMESHKKLSHQVKLATHGV